MLVYQRVLPGYLSHSYGQWINGPLMKFIDDSEGDLPKLKNGWIFQFATLNNQRVNGFSTVNGLGLTIKPLGF